MQNLEVIQDELDQLRGLIKRHEHAVLEAIKALAALDARYLAKTAEYNTAYQAVIGGEVNRATITPGRN